MTMNPNYRNDVVDYKLFKTNEPQDKGRLRRNRVKWILFVTNFLVCIPLLCVIFHFSPYASSCSSPSVLSSWFDVWSNAYREQARTNSINSSGLQRRLHLHHIGLSGILFNNRSLLAWYTFLT
ncbi:hypothetical protein BYT27DRAFT_7287622 [Phlegmacium glaucopus]|nr:hypothetical protein BYT27DRAFT_7287622 [Phlegmacium glaucopus]